MGRSPAREGDGVIKCYDGRGRYTGYIDNITRIRYDAKGVAVGPIKQQPWIEGGVHPGVAYQQSKRNKIARDEVAGFTARADRDPRSGAGTTGKRVTRKLSDAQIIEIRRRVAAGESKQAIARAFKVSAAALYWWLK